MRKRQRGFTLVEVLVAVASGALLLAGLSQILGDVRVGWERSLEASKETTEQRVLTEVVTRTLKAGMAAHADGSAGGLWGDEAGLEILISPPQSGFSLGRMNARLAAELQMDGSFSLVLSLHAARPASGDGTPMEVPLPKRRWMLAAGLKEVQFRYLGVEDKQPRSSWRDRDIAPELVEVRGEYLDSSSPPLWLAVRPRIVMPGECNVDWTSLKCRAS